MDEFHLAPVQIGLNVEEAFEDKGAQNAAHVGGEGFIGGDEWVREEAEDTKLLEEFLCYLGYRGGNSFRLDDGGGNVDGG